MNRLFASLLIFCGLLLGLASPAEAQRGRGHGHDYNRGRGHGRPGPPPRAFHGRGPRYDHAAPYRSYGGRNYYRRQAGPAIIIRP